MNVFNPMGELPMRFGMSIPQSLDAMEHFASLSPDEQRRLIDQTNATSSMDETQSLIQSITGLRDL